MREGIKVTVIILLSIPITMGLMSLVAREPGVDGTCVSRFPTIQDPVTTWRDSGSITVRRPLDPFQE